MSHTVDPAVPARIAEPERSGLQSAFPAGRLASLDAYRGLVMFLMMAEVLRLGEVSRALPDSRVWQILAFNQSHVSWIGCSLHDLIQPSFSFLVGVALPFSIANRLARGQNKIRMSIHAVWRALLLILLGVFLRSIGRQMTNWTFEDTLTQIGLGYAALFLLGFQSRAVQWSALSFILVGYWAAFALYPLPGPEFDYAKVGVPVGWPHLMNGFQGHWNKNSNLAWAFDVWFLNLFPRERPFVANGGGYATLSFIPTLGTMILGLLAGGVLRSEKKPAEKTRWLLLAGVGSLCLGLIVGFAHVCPIVKRIWTPSWTLFSGGCCFLLLAGFYSLMDVKGVRNWAFPLVVIGMNSIAAYCIAHLCEDFVSSSLHTHLGSNIFRIFGTAYEPLVHGAVVLALFWLMLFWMFRRRIFIRI